MLQRRNADGRACQQKGVGLEHAGRDEQGLAEDAVRVVTVGTGRLDVDLVVRRLAVEDRSVDHRQTGQPKLERERESPEEDRDTPHGAPHPYADPAARFGGPSTGIRNQKVLPLP